MSKIGKVKLKATSEDRESTRLVNAQPPLEDISAKISSPSTAAGGVTAVMKAMKHTLKEMGPNRSLKTLLKINQKDGFDCPSCAWPDPEERQVAEFCENGAKAVADEATKKQISREFFQQWSVEQLSQQSDFWLGKQGRLTEPMFLRRGSSHYEPISWQEAFDLIASTLNRLVSPDEAVFYTSGRTSNEAAFLYQLFVRLYGTNNLPDCSNMCHESSGRGLSETIGVGKGTVSLEDFTLADAIFIIGQNPGTNHPRMLITLQEAARRGCKIVTINPLPEPGLIRFKYPQEISGVLGSGTAITSLFLQVRINGDVALLKGIMKEMLEQEDAKPGTVLDWQFIKEQTIGFEEFATSLKAANWDEIVEQSGIDRKQITEAAKVAIEAKRMIVCWAMGLTQHKNAVGNIQEIVNLLLMRGQLGKPGAGACPVRGHSNVQGDRTMGIWEKPKKEFLDRLAEVFGFEPPRKHGYDTVEAIEAMHRGDAKVFFAMGGNFLSATPDTEYTARALQRCELTVNVSTKLNRTHIVTGQEALILPCLGRTEIDKQASGIQFVSVEDSMSIVHASQGHLKPASELLLSEAAIVARLAKAVFKEEKVDWNYLVADYDRIRDLIEKVVPGFENYNSRIRKPGGFYLPNPVRERTFKTTSGKAHFSVHPIPKIKLRPGQFMMMTIRSHDQFNTTIYGLEDRYRGVYQGRRVVFLNKEDIKEMGLRAGQWVDLKSHFEGEERVARRFAVVSYDIPRRCAATYFPEANALVPIRSVAEKSNTPASKSVVISISISKEED
ncbi:MAG: FdhF/YdeP family oxidoreductase [Blastocatellia bacterium]|nr:FdhF/YdeP family oxidoreductase [Blastocatellia bacterium]